MSDLINKPPHYTYGAIEAIDAIESWKLGFHLGNVVKYIVRAAHKGSMLDDLRKARWYIDRAIALEEGKAARVVPIRTAEKLSEAFPDASDYVAKGGV